MNFFQPGYVSRKLLRAAVVLGLLALPLLFNDLFIQHVLVISCIYLIVLLGLNIVTGLTGQVSLCQAAFYGVGAYTSAILVLHFRLPFWVSMPTAGAVAGLLGFLLSSCTVKMRAHYLALATIGFGEILVNVFRSAERWTGGANGLSSIPPPTIFGWAVNTPQSYYYLTLSIAILAYLGMSLLVRTQLGGSLQAIRENELAVSSLGVNTIHLKISAFTLSAIYAGVAGALYAHFDGFIGPESFSTGHSILLFSVVVVGGLVRPLGSVLAVGLFVLGQEFFRAFTQYQLVLFGATVIIVYPEGFAGLLAALYRRLFDSEEESERRRISEWRLDTAVDSGGHVRDSLAPAQSLHESPTPEADSLIESPHVILIKDVTLTFGGVLALDKVSFSVKAGEILCLIGPNGAGKTSLLNILGGQFRPDGGDVRLQFANTRKPRVKELIPFGTRPPFKIARLGLSRTFQTSQLFSELSVLDNVVVGRFMDPSTRPSVLGTILSPWKAIKKDKSARRAAEDWLRFSGLHPYRERLAKHLPYGLRRVLEITRCLATEPAVILLDEPSAGMNQTERTMLMRLLRKINDFGITLLIVAHDLELVRDLSDRVVVLDHGKIIFSGVPEDLRKDNRVVAAYLGSHSHACAAQ